MHWTIQSGTTLYREPVKNENIIQAFKMGALRFITRTHANYLL